MGCGRRLPAGRRSCRGARLRPVQFRQARVAGGAGNTSAILLTGRG
jgi:hypothetical protein